MTSISAFGSNAISDMQKNLFNKLDTDKSGTLSKDEFVSGRPKNMSEDQASAVYAKLDSGSTGAVTLDQLESARPEHGRPEGTTSSRAMSAVMELHRGGHGHGGWSEGGQGAEDSAQPANLADIYKDMDLDGNGSVSKSEFLAARPDHMSESRAAAAFDKIDSQSTGSISEEQFEAAVKGRGGHDAPETTNTATTTATPAVAAASQPVVDATATADDVVETA
jgi:Ca2+-binding EF-hand superfamily protein